MSRFSEAISEGDGISVIPVLEGDLEALVRLAEEAGAEAIGVLAVDVERARGLTGLPIVARDGRPQVISDAGGDAIVVEFGAASADGVLESIYAHAAELDLDFAVDVRDEEELEDTLARIDPEIVLISEHGLDDDEEDLERTLDLLVRRAGREAGRVGGPDRLARPGPRPRAGRRRRDPRPRARARARLRRGSRGSRPWPRGGSLVDARAGAAAGLPPLRAYRPRARGWPAKCHGTAPTWNGAVATRRRRAPRRRTRAGRSSARPRRRAAARRRSSSPCSAAIVPQRPSWTRSAACRPKRVARTRSRAVGVPPRCTCPRTVTRVS